MIRAFLTLAILLPATVVAQEIETPILSRGLAAAETEASRSLSRERVAVTAPAQQPVSTPAAEFTRRRPSMVGYIGDAVIKSQFRVRFDVGYEMDTPDRAEFFYAKCGCYRDLADAIPAAFDPDAPGPGPGVVTDLDFRQLYFQAEYAPSGRASIFAELPFRWIDPQSFIPGLGSFGSQSGLSDVRLGAKLGLSATPDQSVTFQLQAAAPTGEPLEGLGTDHWSLEPALLYYQAIGDRVAIESQFGAVFPLSSSAGVPTAGPDDFAGNVIFYGFGPSVEVYSGDTVRFAPVVELVGWHILDGFETIPPEFPATDGINIVNLKVGGRLVFQDQSSLYIGYGHALTDVVWYDDILRIEYRYTF